MLGLIFIFFLGRAYFRLAEKHNRIKWLWAILGILIYYAISVILGVILGLVAYEWAMMNDFLLTLLAIGVSIGGSIGVYYILKNSWEKQGLHSDDNELIDEIN